MKRLTIAIKTKEEEGLIHQFKVRCLKQGKTMREVLLKLMNGYTNGEVNK